MPATATAPETVLMGRCVTCRRPFRITVPVTFAHPGRVWHAALVATGVDAPLCDCAAGRCPQDADGVPACGDWHCQGHGPSAVWWTPLTMEYKADVYCPVGGGSCWTAKSSKCTCSCRGANHGGMYALTRTVA